MTAGIGDVCTGKSDQTAKMESHFLVNSGKTTTEKHSRTYGNYDTITK